jgi:hypothetical protein
LDAVDDDDDDDRTRCWIYERVFWLCWRLSSIYMTNYNLLFAPMHAGCSAIHLISTQEKHTSCKMK